MVTVIPVVPVLVSTVPDTVAVPAATAVTRPPLLTVATDVLELDQVTVRPVTTVPASSRTVGVS
jgi:hypothetical protein